MVFTNLRSRQDVRNLIDLHRNQVQVSLHPFVSWSPLRRSHNGLFRGHGLLVWVWCCFSSRLRVCINDWLFAHEEHLCRDGQILNRPGFAECPMLRSAFLLKALVRVHIHCMHGARMLLVTVPFVIIATTHHFKYNLNVTHEHDLSVQKAFQKRDFARFFAPKLVLWWICDRIHSFSNLSDSQFNEYDRLDPILSFSINWESDRLEKEWIRAQIHYNTNFGAKKRAKSRFWNLLEYIPCMNYTQNVFITWQKQHEFWRELLPKSRNSFNITDSKAILQRCENEEIGEVLARECGRNRTL